MINIIFNILYFFSKFRLFSKGWWIFYYLDFFRKKIVLKNLNIAFPKKSQKEKIKIAKQTYKNFLTFFEDMIIYNKNPNLFRTIKIKNEEILKKAINTNKPIILLSAHFGNWELGSKFIYYQYNLPIAGVMREIKENKLFNELIKKTRGNADIKLINKQRGAKEILKTLLKEKRIVGILIDQYTKNENAPVVYFFKPTKFNPALSKLAKTSKAIVLPFFIYKENNNYIAYFDKFKTYEDFNSIDEFTSWQAKKIEEMIKKYPDEYYWFHDRWKV